MIQLTFTLKMTTPQVVETSVTVNNRELKHRRRMTGRRRPEVNSWCFEWIAHVSASQAVVVHTSTTEFWVSWRSPENVSSLTCLNSRKLGVYPGFILYELFDSFLVDKACFYRILLFITYSVNAPLTSVFFQENQHGFFARHYEERVSIRSF